MLLFPEMKLLSMSSHPQPLPRAKQSIITITIRPNNIIYLVYRVWHIIKFCFTLPLTQPPQDNQISHQDIMTLVLGHRPLSMIC